MDPLGLVALLVGAGWIIGKLPGREKLESKTVPLSKDTSTATIVTRVGKTAVKKSSIQVLPEYELAKDLVRGKFPLIFVTGGAGTGKSTFISWLTAQFDGHVLVGAPTGVAALNVQGKTLHSLCALPPAWILNKDIKEYKSSIARGASLLIIDEISMVNANLLDGVSEFFKKNRGVDRPFGGLPVVLVGDLFQLPPVVSSSVRELFATTYKSSKFHGAKSLSDCPYYAIELTKAFRQVDQNFVDILGRIREGLEVDAAITSLNSDCLITEEPPEGAVWLSPRNKEVEGRNSRKLEELPGPSIQFHGQITGIFKEDRLPSPLVIDLRIGAQVMFTKNSTKWVNGSIGTVTRLLSASVHVRLHETGDEVEVVRESWEQFDYFFDRDDGEIKRSVVGTYTQIPLILAWSVTIHKSQGKTIERVHIDLGKGAFEAGQTYVALSRCRSMDKLSLSRPLERSDIRVDPEVQSFYNAIRTLIATTPPDKMRKSMKL